MVGADWTVTGADVATGAADERDARADTGIPLVLTVKLVLESLEIEFETVLLNWEILFLMSSNKLMILILLINETVDIHFASIYQHKWALIK